MSGLASLIADGFALGWAVAWPPGPINAEMIRRGLAAGFRPALAVGLGACSADAVWATAVTLGIGLAVGTAARFDLALASALLLLALAAMFLSGAWRGWRRWRKAAPATAEGGPRGPRGGYLSGLGMAFTSPWNLAFWLAVMGRPQAQQSGLAGALVIAASVILGAAMWCLLLCALTTRLRARFAGPAWQFVAMGLTGLLMLGFAAHQFRLLLAA